ncbi:hypothetical protein [Chroococcus sp. FPU101]|uniref:hypothetical protein n=1 Tax=Chroococcus sp. FPU101 TaxID=1974212 RepID=UPI001A8D7E03|nr:hypothetical protein [Chroococcus sp. FPU101]GFE71637.1 hypothetical protein CFPU101_42470 [Chroococcus sp. FPU101]
MKVYLKDDILYIKQDDLPQYKKGGSVVRNSYFWALKSIACFSNREKDWEFDQDIWLALARMLLFFTQSGYLGYSETILEFASDDIIPDDLRSVSTRL